MWLTNVQTTLLLLSLFFFHISAFFGSQPQDETAWKEKRIALSNVQALTLYQDRMAVGRRSTVPQLNCIAGAACSDRENQPRVVQCTNQGRDQSGEIQWKCDADLNHDVTFGKIDVSCEGFSGPGDPFVLEGSCGLEYELHYVKGAGNRNSHYSGYDQYSGQYNNGGGSLLSFIFIGLFIYVIWKNGPGTGFWGGMATGGLLGYLFGRPRYGYGYGGYPSYGYGGGMYGPAPARPYFGGGGGWGGGGFGGGGGGFGGGGTRSASGFGGTRTR